jgi:hypothetical protein
LCVREAERGETSVRRGEVQRSVSPAEFSFPAGRDPRHLDGQAPALLPLCLFKRLQWQLCGHSPPYTAVRGPLRRARRGVGGLGGRVAHKKKSGFRAREEAREAQRQVIVFLKHMS